MGDQPLLPKPEPDEKSEDQETLPISGLRGLGSWETMDDSERALIDPEATYPGGTFGLYKG